MVCWGSDDGQAVTIARPVRRIRWEDLDGGIDMEQVRTNWRGPKPTDEVARFWSKVEKTDGCWLWTGVVDKKGYGLFMRTRPNPSRRVFAHRFAYYLTYGSVSSEFHVCHRCDNPRCVNPAHLFVGTAMDNHEDSKRKGRQAQGERCPQARFTESQVIAMRERYRAGGISLTELGREYDADFRTIWLIVRGVTWKHVPGALTKGR